MLLLFQLLDTKSTDRKMTLLHYIALTVKEKYPELANFYNELHFVDKAAAGKRYIIHSHTLLLLTHHAAFYSFSAEVRKCSVRFLANETNCNYIVCVCVVSLENVLLDVKELGKGMELIRRECSLHDHAVLKGFLQASDLPLDKLQKDAKTAEVTHTFLLQSFRRTCIKLTLY